MDDRTDQIPNDPDLQGQSADAEGGIRPDEAPADPHFRWVARYLPGILYHCRHGADGVLDYSYVSDRLRDITGFAPEELYADGELILSRFHPEDLIEYKRKMLRVLAERKESDWGLEFRFKHKDGHYLWLSSHANRNYGEDGSVDTWGVFLDITDRRIVEQERRMSELQLRESQRQLTTLLSNLQGMAYRCNNDQDYTMHFVSEGSLELTGYTPSELQFNRKTTFAELIHPEDRERVWREVQEAVTNWRPFTLTFRIVTVDQTVKWVYEQGRGVFSNEGKLQALEGFITDITEQKRAQLEIVRAKEIAEAASQAKSDFVANISHEIRTPLNGILGVAQLLGRSPLNNQQREYVDNLRSSSDTLLKIVNDILDFSRIEAGQLHLEDRPFSCVMPIEEIVDMFSSRAARKGLVVRMQPADDMPKGVRGDPFRLKQVLMNLMSNAVKFTEEGQIIIRAMCEERTEDMVSLRYEVADTGIGIPEDKMDSVFDKFTQVDAASTRRYGGTGLGLAISRNLVELMGGEMGVRSYPNSGSCFWFTLPFKAIPDSEHEAELAKPKQDSAALIENSPSCRVLVVEDNAINQRVAQRMLEQLRCEVGIAGNGEEAISALAIADYDLIFMDCQMPVMDGFETTQVIRESCDDERQRIPIVAMTANAMTGAREKCLASGMDDYVSKPVRLEDMAAAIKRWVGKTDRLSEIELPSG